MGFLFRPAFLIVIISMMAHQAISVPVEFLSDAHLNMDGFKLVPPVAFSHEDIETSRSPSGESWVIKNHSDAPIAWDSTAHTGRGGQVIIEPKQTHELISNQEKSPTGFGPSPMKIKSYELHSKNDLWSVSNRDGGNEVCEIYKAARDKHGELMAGDRLFSESLRLHQTLDLYIPHSDQILVRVTPRDSTNPESTSLKPKPDLITMKGDELDDLLNREREITDKLSLKEVA
ncbi:hypothetical protein Pst134EA_017845 [Puccinia striiformis f. sp. tritici]|uniref:hypothetical protein n=1 Tax=Puccinia striiformis f. sp. tritici TaxID=168172 RepID=UPI00200824CB|nr:hypothetical protein Pst134EA_017845 [Puccinia striiformis f. sp. tritici]KAH9461546.1 hypothetical protein Pst134EA_017845 [Puccinia striiformis f. sp. tritici]